ncbi:MAG: hypothetical protein IT371_21430 [Deltaproteobacteria bacterium]|nr:hypothetical protein [Deltaproteobacteria bacterium]
MRATFADLQEITRSIREVRAAAGVTPRQPLRVTFVAPPARLEAVLSQRHVVQRLAGVESLEPSATGRREPGCAGKVLGEIQLFVHGVIDDAAEQARLQKELVRLEKEIGACEKKLGSAGFVDRAPPEVVQEQRERLAGYLAQKDAIAESLGELG